MAEFDTQSSQASQAGGLTNKFLKVALLVGTAAMATGCAGLNGGGSYGGYSQGGGNGYPTAPQDVYPQQRDVTTQGHPWSGDQRYRMDAQAREQGYQNELRQIEANTRAGHLRCDQMAVQQGGRIANNTARWGLTLGNGIDGVILSNNTATCHQNTNANEEIAKTRARSNYMRDIDRMNQNFQREWDRAAGDYARRMQQQGGNGYGMSQQQKICEDRANGFLRQGKSLPAGDACWNYIRR